MQQITPDPKENNNSTEDSTNHTHTLNDSDPESDTLADVTPRNIDPSDENSAEPDIEEDPGK